MPEMESARPIDGRVGGPSGCPVMAANPRHGLGEGAEAGPVAVGAVLAEPGDPDQHQAGVEIVQHVPTDAPALQRARAEVLDHHIGLGGQARNTSAPSGSPRYSPMQRLLRDTIFHHSPWPSSGRAVGPEGVAALGVLDLDHVGAVVAEDLGAQGSGQHGGEVDDPQTGQGARGRERLWAGSCMRPPSWASVFLGDRVGSRTTSRHGRAPGWPRCARRRAARVPQGGTLFQSVGHASAEVNVTRAQEPVAATCPSAGCSRRERRSANVTAGSRDAGRGRSPAPTGGPNAQPKPPRPPGARSATSPPSSAPPTCCSSSPAARPGPSGSPRSPAHSASPRQWCIASCRRCGTGTW